MQLDSVFQVDAKVAYVLASECQSVTSQQFYLDHNQELNGKRMQICLTIPAISYIPQRRMNDAMVCAPVPRYLEHKSGTFCN